MTQNQGLRRAVALIVPLFFLFFVLFTACEKKVKETVTETVHDTTVVHDTIVVNIISVDSVYATPDNVTQGEPVTLSVDASAMPSAGTLSYFWEAQAGKLSATTGDTVVWTSPDDPGAYNVFVHVTDGEHIAIGKRLIGVGMFAPTVTPYYVGDGTCNNCHSGKHLEWANTMHANAWADLMTNAHAGPSCFPCHSVQTLPTPITGNAGFDEVPITKFENVQCENCHGPGSVHASGPTSNQEVLSFDAEVCGKCHDGTHHPYLTQWESSLHGMSLESHAAPNGSCQGCHEGVAAAMRLESTDISFYGGGGSTRDTLNYHGIDGAIAASLEVPFAAITCQTCHNPHSDENVGQLRTVKDVTFISGDVISGAGAGQLCIQCHHARHSAEEEVPEGNAHFGPHPGTQGDVIFGQNGAEDVNTDPNFVWQSTGHHSIPDVCAACHVYQTSSDPITGETSTGHTFLPTPSACQQCHGVQVTSFTDIMADKDFDNDGSIEGLQDEVVGLMDLLAEKLVEADTTDSLMGTDPSVEAVISAIEGTAGITTPLAVELRTAGWNLVLAEDDHSKGIHNPAYVVQLLQQSVLFLDPNGLPSGSILSKPQATTFRATASIR